MTIAITDFAPTVGTTELSIPAGATYSAGSPQTTTGHVEFVADFALLASGDAFRVRVYEKATAAGTQRKVVEYVFEGVQDAPLFKLPLGIMGRGWDVTLQKIVGTDRSIPCSLRTDDGGVSISAADIRAAIGLASANLDTQLDALPTNAELTTALAAADDATLAAIDALPTATENADALLNRDMSAVSDTNARTPLNAMRFLRNRWSLSGTTLTVTEEDDTTTAWTAVVTPAPGADPISGSNPT
jgi:hypothetical protein